MSLGTGGMLSIVESSDHATEGRAQLMAPLTGDGCQLSRAVFDLPPITECVTRPSIIRSTVHPLDPVAVRPPIPFISAEKSPVQDEF